MQTRSQTRMNNNIIIDNNIFKEIDFDEASREWRANKKQLPNGCYRYICGKMSITGNKCLRKPFLNNETCAMHTKK